MHIKQKNQQQIIKQQNIGNNIPFWIVPVACLIYGVSAALVVYKIPPILTLIIDDFHTDAYTASLLMSSITFIGFLLAVPTGFLEKRFGAKKLVACSACCGFLGCFLSSFASFFGNASITVLLATRCLEGVCYILASVCVPIIICRLVPKERAGISTCIWASWVSLGGIVSANLTPSLWLGLGWTSTMLIYALFVAITSFVMFIVLHFSSQNQKANTRTNKKCSDSFVDQKVHSRLSVVLWFVSWLLLSALMAAVYNYTATAVQKLGEYDSVFAGELASLPMIVSIFSKLAAGVIADRQKTYKYVYTFGIAVIAIAVVLIFTNVGNCMLIGAVLAGIGLGAPSITALAIIQLLPEKWHSVGMGVGMATCCFGQSAGNYIIQVILGNDFNNWTITAVALFVVGIISFVASCLVKVDKIK